MFVSFTVLPPCRSQGSSEDKAAQQGRNNTAFVHEVRNRKWNHASPQGAKSVESHPKTPPDQDHKTRHHNIRTSVACRTAVVPSALEWAFRSMWDTPGWSEISLPVQGFRSTGMATILSTGLVQEWDTSTLPQPPQSAPDAAPHFGPNYKGGHP